MDVDSVVDCPRFSCAVQGSVKLVVFGMLGAVLAHAAKIEIP